jgi:hypothetical protein
MAGRPTDAPLPVGYFGGWHNLCDSDRGLLVFLNQLEARVNGTLTADDLQRAKAFGNTERPDPTTVPAGSIIFNTDDSTLNVSDGTNWRDMAGTIT